MRDCKVSTGDWLYIDSGIVDLSSESSTDWQRGTSTTLEMWGISIFVNSAGPLSFMFCNCNIYKASSYRKITIVFITNTTKFEWTILRPLTEATSLSPTTTLRGTYIGFTESCTSRWALSRKHSPLINCTRISNFRCWPVWRILLDIEMHHQKQRLSFAATLHIQMNHHNQRLMFAATHGHDHLPKFWFDYH